MWTQRKTHKWCNIFENLKKPEMNKISNKNKEIEKKHKLCARKKMENCENEKNF